MKYIKVLLLIIALSVAGSIFAARPIFADLPAGEDIEKIYLSKSLLRMAGADDINLQGVSLEDLGKDYLDNIEVVNIETRRHFRQAYDILDQYVDKNNLEVMMLKKSDGEKVTIYGKPIDETGETSVMIIVKEDEDELNIVVISGRFNASTGIDF